MHALRWQPTLNPQARAALTALRGSCAARQRFYSQPAPHGDYADRPHTDRRHTRGPTKFVKRSMEVRGRNGIKFRQSSSPLATNSLGKQAEVLILSDTGKSNQNQSGGSAAIADGLSQLEMSRILTDLHGSKPMPAEAKTDSKSILDVLANEESSSRNDDLVAHQIESIRPKCFEDAHHPVISKRAFKKITASLDKSFTTQQLRTYHNNLLKALQKGSNAPQNSVEEFWGEKWDPEDMKSDNASGQQQNKNDKSNVIDSIIRSLWRVEVKAEAVEVGSVNGCISEFHFSLLSSGVPPKLEEIAKMRGVTIQARPKLKSAGKKQGKKDPESHSIALKHARFTPKESPKSKDGQAVSDAGPGKNEKPGEESKSQKLAQQSSSDWYISITGRKEPTIQAARDIDEITKFTSDLHVRLPRTLDDSLTALRYKEQKLTLPASRRNVIPRWNTETLALVAHRTGTVIRLSFNGNQRLDSKLRNRKVTAIISSGRGNADRLEDAKRILLTFARFPYPHGARNVHLDPEFSGKTAISQYVPTPTNDLPIAMRDYRFSPLSRWTVATLASSFEPSFFKKEDPTAVAESRIAQLRALISGPHPKLTLDEEKSPWDQKLGYSVVATVGMLLSPKPISPPVEVDAAAKCDGNLESASQASTPAKANDVSMSGSEEVFFWPIVPNTVAALNSMRSTQRVRAVETLRIRMVPHDAMKRLQPNASDDPGVGKKKRQAAKEEPDTTEEAHSAQKQPTIANMVAPDIYLDFEVEEFSTGERVVTFMDLFAVVKEGSDEIRYPSTEIDLQLRKTLLATLIPENLDEQGQADLRTLRKHVEDFILDAGPLKPPAIKLAFPPHFPLGRARTPGKPWSADGLLTGSPAPGGALHGLPAEKKARYVFASAERRAAVDFAYGGQRASVTKVSSDVHGDWQDLALSLQLSPPPDDAGEATEAERVDAFARAALALVDEVGVVERRTRVQRGSEQFATVEEALVEEAEGREWKRQWAGETDWVSLDLGLDREGSAVGSDENQTLDDIQPGKDGVQSVEDSQ